MINPLQSLVLLYYFFISYRAPCSFAGLCFEEVLFHSARKTPNMSAREHHQIKTKKEQKINESTNEDGKEAATI